MTLYSLVGFQANRLDCEGPSPTLTTTLSSLALAAVVFLIKRVEIPFLSLIGKLDDSIAASYLNHLCGKLCNPSWTLDQCSTSHHYSLHSRCVYLSQGLSWCDCPYTVPLDALNPSKHHSLASTCVLNPSSTSKLCQPACSPLWISIWSSCALQVTLSTISNKHTLQLVGQFSPAHSIIGVYSGYADIPTA